MSFIEIIFIALGLAMDAFAVSISCGLAVKQERINNALKVGLFFGGFQAIMPIIGWFAGINLRNFISGIDHWVAFGLLALIGCRMIYEAVSKKGNKKEINFLDGHVLLILSIATSIDALAVGVSFAFLKIFIVKPIIVIGVVTFILSFLGVFLANKFGRFLGKKIEVFGGLILIGIGIRILFEHLF